MMRRSERNLGKDQKIVSVGRKLDKWEIGAGAGR